MADKYNLVELQLLDAEGESLRSSFESKSFDLLAEDQQGPLFLLTPENFEARSAEEQPFAFFDRTTFADELTRKIIVVRIGP